MISSEIRTEARKSLQGKWGSAVLITLIYFLFSMLVSYILEKAGSLAFLLELIYFVVSIPISFGIMVSMIKLKRSDSVGPFDFFKDGFANFSRAWTITGNILKKLAVYLVVALIGMILFAISLSFGIASSIIASSSAGSYTVLSFVGLFVYLAALVLMIPKSFLYVLAMYIGFDNPNMSSKETVEKSSELMMGNRWRYFCLSFSFIGWVILGAFTLCIGYLWLVPYMSVSQIVFYDELVGNSNSNPLEVKKEDTTEGNDDPIQSNE